MIAVHCESPACTQDITTYTRTYQVDSLRAPCPLCGLSGYLVPCERIHLIALDPKGPLRSGEDGKRYAFLCAKANDGFKKHARHKDHPVHFTAVPRACTCVDCLLAYGAKQIGTTEFSLEQ